jgi:hypothetical protein
VPLDITIGRGLSLALLYARQPGQGNAAKKL